MPRFKKAEEELVPHFDKWRYVLRHLREFQDKAQRLQEMVFKKLFNQAEVAKLSPEEMRNRDESLKIYRGSYRTIETAKHEGREQEDTKDESKAGRRGRRQNESHLPDVPNKKE